MRLAATDGDGVEPENDQKAEGTRELFVQPGIGVCSWLQSTSRRYRLTLFSGVGISIARAIALMDIVARPGTALFSLTSVRLT